ncbi:MAG: hypothetical protein IJL89_07935 [Firmicutes bacterium]|nr:hypothetical protein [Bacillota bacterium]
MEVLRAAIIVGKKQFVRFFNENSHKKLILPQEKSTKIYNKKLTQNGVKRQKNCCVVSKKTVFARTNARFAFLFIFTIKKCRKVKLIMKNVLIFACVVL